MSDAGQLDPSTTEQPPPQQRSIEHERPVRQFELHELEPEPGVRTLTLVGELDIAAAPTLHSAVERVCSDGAKTVTFDLRGLTFLDSTGLAAIVLANKICETNGYDFSLIGGSASTQRLFELTGLIDVLPFRDEAGADTQAEPLEAHPGPERAGTHGASGSAPQEHEREHG